MPNNKFFINALALTVLILINTSSVFSQLSSSTTSAVIGVIKDQQQSAIVGANITIENIETNAKRNLISDEKGQFYFTNLQVGKYKIKVDAQGFRAQNSVTVLTVGITGIVDFVLLPGESQDLIEINAENSLQESKIENSINIGQNKIENLPINRRNYLDFSAISPRVVSDRLPNVGIGATSGLSFDGQSGRVNNVTIDGLDNNDRSTGSVRTIFSQDSIREYQILNDGYSAEYGRSLAGVINIVTKSGKNLFNGDVFFLNRNDKISARDVFAPFKPPFSQSQFGIRFGGPIKENKAFFFAAFERATTKQNNIVTISNETVAAARRQLFPISNGVIPFSLGTTSLLLRADFNFSPNNIFWIRYNRAFNYNGAFQVFGGLTAESSTAKQFFDSSDIALSNTYINPSQSLVNETRFLFARLNQDVVSDINSPQVQLSANEGRVLFGRFFLLPQTRLTHTYQIVNNTTLIKNKVTTKFGVDIQYLSIPKDRLQIAVGPKGILTFAELNFSALFGIPNLPVLNSLQALDSNLRTPEQIAFLRIAAPLLPSLFPGFPSKVPVDSLPIPLAYIQGFGNPFASEDGKSLQFATFLQEDLALKDNLKLKLGVRYDLNRANFNPDNNGNFSPRVGFAYNPKGSRLTFRASYGLFFGVQLFATNLLANLIMQKNRYNILVLPAPFSILPFTLPGRSIPESQSLPAKFPFIRQLSQSFSTQPSLRNSYTQQATFAADYLIKENMLASLTYNYVRGLKLFSVREINPIVRPFANLTDGFIKGRSNPDLGSIMSGESAFDSYYHSLTFSFTQKVVNKVDLLASYTYSKAIDNSLVFIATDSRIIDPANNSLDIGNERGLSIQDLRHRLILSGSFRLDFGKKPILQNYQVSVIASLNSGRPYNLLAGRDLNRDGDGSGDRPANLGRNVGVAPGFASLDVRLKRSWKIKALYLETFTECFNLFNKKNIDPNQLDRIFAPDKDGFFNLPQKDAGRFTLPKERFRGAFSPRQIQLGLRISF